MLIDKFVNRFILSIKMNKATILLDLRIKR